MKLYNHKAPNHKQATIDKIKKIPIGKRATDVDSTWKFEGNYKRLFPDKPSKTVTCHCWSELTHPFKDRNLTVRECARLQSFPDTYIFTGKRVGFHGRTDDSTKKLHMYALVGNSVPPLLAKAIGESCLLMLANPDIPSGLEESIQTCV